MVYVVEGDDRLAPRQRVRALERRFYKCATHSLSVSITS